MKYFRSTNNEGEFFIVGWANLLSYSGHNEMMLRRFMAYYGFPKAIVVQSGQVRRHAWHKESVDGWLAREGEIRAGPLVLN